MAAASAAPAATGGAIAPAVAAGASKFSLSGLLGLANLGVGTATSLYGANKADKTARYQADLQATSVAEQMALERERLAEEKSQFMTQQDELRRQWAAQQAFQAKQFAASEDERLYNRKLLEDREGRKAARATRLRQFLGY